MNQTTSHQFQVGKIQLSEGNLFSSAIFAIPEKIFLDKNKKISLCVFTHGYTASKADCLSWLHRLAMFGLPVIIFDLPGHYLGHSSEVGRIEDFASEVKQVFILAFEFLKNSMKQKPDFTGEEFNYILGGHSLGATMSLITLNDRYFENKNTLSFLVGSGMLEENKHHVLSTPIFNQTMKMREQLVSRCLRAEAFFNWSKDLKKNMRIENRKIHLITGKDDLIADENSILRLKNFLENQNNIVTTDVVNNLPHHEPLKANVHIFAKLKTEFY